MLVEVICLREGGIKLTTTELRAAPRHKGHLRVHRGTARLTLDDESPATVGDIIRPLEQVKLHGVSGPDMVLHGLEQPLVDQFRIGPPQLQAWWVRPL